MPRIDYIGWVIGTFGNSNIQVSTGQKNLGFIGFLIGWGGWVWLINILAFGNGLLNSCFSIGPAIGVVLLVPFLPHPSGTPEQSVDALLVTAGPKGEHAAECQIAVTGVAAIRTLPQRAEFISVSGAEGSFEQFVVAASAKAPSRFALGTAQIVPDLNRDAVARRLRGACDRPLRNRSFPVLCRQICGPFERKQRLLSLIP